MKRLLLVLSFVCGISEAQSPPALPQTLAELAAVFPHLIYTQPKPYDFGPFSEAWTSPLKKDPASAGAVAPILSRDLQDTDQQVQFCTLALLSGLELQPDGVELVAPFSAQIANAIATGNEAPRRWHSTW